MRSIGHRLAALPRPPLWTSIPVLGVLLLTTGLSHFVSQQTEQQLREQLNRRGENVLRVLASRSELPGEAENPAAARSATRLVESFSHLEGLRVLDGQGTPLVAAGRSDWPAQLPERGTFRHENERFLYLSEALPEGGQLQLVLNKQHIREMVEWIRRGNLISALGSAAILALAILAVRRRHRSSTDTQDGRATELAPLHSAIPATPEASRHTQQTARILVVDDDHSSRLIMCGILNRDGYHSDEAENGAQALAACREQMPDLILMDAMMPEMDGFQASERILRLAGERPPAVLMITALDDDGILDRAFAAGAQDFIAKPISATVLRQRVARLLQAGQLNRRLQQLSRYDHLTSLPNRAVFMEAGRRHLETAAAQQEPFAILVLDLDRFRIVNESQGHERGDRLLREVSKHLEAALGPRDLLCRVTSDEFTLLLANTGDEETARRTGEDLLTAVAGPVTVDNSPTELAVSAGLALYPDHGEELEILLKRAAAALPLAKARGGNRLCLYQEGMDREIARRAELEVEIHRALASGEFVLHYQPQLRLPDFQVVGLEALIRWQHPQHGLLSPAEFIPIAEQSRLVEQIGNWVTGEACRQLRAWRDAGREPLPVAINVSGSELGEELLVERIRSHLDTAGLEPELLKLEITEDSLARSDASTVRELRELRRLGVSLAIDDFGIGYSSLAYLKQFPADFLKIDRSFVHDLPDDPNSIAIIAGIVALARSLGMDTIAEGVETEAQCQFLRDHGCGSIQGFLTGAALPAARLEDWLDQWDGERWREAARRGSVTAFRRTRHLP